MCKIWGLIFCPAGLAFGGLLSFWAALQVCSHWFFLLHESCLLLKILLENSILVAGHYGHWLVVSMGNLLCISLGVPVILDQPIIVCNPSPPSYITCIHLWWKGLLWNFAQCSILHQGCIFFPKIEFFINHYLEHRVFL